MSEKKNKDQEYFDSKINKLVNLYNLIPKKIRFVINTLAYLSLLVMVLNAIQDIFFVQKKSLWWILLFLGASILATIISNYRKK